VSHHIRRATPLIAVDFEILALSDATTRLRALPLLQSLDNSPSLGNFRSMDERVVRAREIDCWGRSAKAAGGILARFPVEPRAARIG